MLLLRHQVLRFMPTQIKNQNSELIECSGCKVLISFTYDEYIFTDSDDRIIGRGTGDVYRAAKCPVAQNCLDKNHAEDHQMAGCPAYRELERIVRAKSIDRNHPH